MICNVERVYRATLCKQCQSDFLDHNPITLVCKIRHFAMAYLLFSVNRECHAGTTRRSKPLPPFHMLALLMRAFVLQLSGTVAVSVRSMSLDFRSGWPSLRLRGIFLPLVQVRGVRSSGANPSVASRSMICEGSRMVRLHARSKKAPSQDSKDINHKPHVKRHLYLQSKPRQRVTLCLGFLLILVPDM